MARRTAPRRQIGLTAAMCGAIHTTCAQEAAKAQFIVKNFERRVLELRRDRQDDAAVLYEAMREPLEALALELPRTLPLLESIGKHLKRVEDAHGAILDATAQERRALKKSRVQQVGRGTLAVRRKRRPRKKVTRRASRH